MESMSEEVNVFCLVVVPAVESKELLKKLVSSWEDRDDGEYTKTVHRSTQNTDSMSSWIP